jgi:hypothetical protein
MRVTGKGPMSQEGYPPIGALAPVGDGRSLALVGPDGGVEFLCPLRFDAPPVVFPLLDRARGGRLRAGPAGAGGRSCRMAYRPGSAVLELDWPTGQGRVRGLLGMMWPPPRAGQELLWLLEGVAGAVQVEVVVAPRPGFGRDTPAVAVDGCRAALTTASTRLTVTVSDLQCTVTDGGVRADAVLRPGQRLAVRVHLGPPGTTAALPSADISSVTDALATTDAAWRAWSGALSGNGWCSDQVCRSAITLKQLIYQPTGAVVAAATTSLPERLGGVRNWDYRYTWLRDAGFTLNALHKLGCRAEAVGYARWLCRTTAAHGLPLRVLYGIDGRTGLTEDEVPGLDGYRGSRPVRVGNAAEDQLQLDSYGELLDCLAICEVMGEDAMRGQWPHFARLIDFTASHWRLPDAGIWEVRSAPRHFVHSKALAWVALDRGCRLAGTLGLPGDRARWRAEARMLREQVLGCGMRGGHFVRSYGEDAVDASLLMLPLVGFVDGSDPRMLATIDAVRAQLTPPGAIRPGLLYRYPPPRAGAGTGDGLPGGEGAFTVCSFWLVETLILAGRAAEAADLYEGLVTLGGDLQLFAEQIDPATGEQLGNTPQAFTHIGLINAALRLTGATTADRRHRTAPPIGKSY